MAERQGIKLEDSELKQVKELNEEYQKKIVDFGQLKIKKVELQQQLHELDIKEKEMEVDLLKVRSKDMQLQDVLAEKYGSGYFDEGKEIYIQDK